jgi:hypothetical protein
MHERRLGRWVWVFAGLIMIGCTTHRAPLTERRIEAYSGHYVPGPKDSWFRPCSTTEEPPKWWVTLRGRAAGQFDQLRAEHRVEDGQSYFVTWNGVLTTRSDVGSSGSGPALLVEELLSFGLQQDNDCVSADTAP